MDLDKRQQQAYKAAWTLGLHLDVMVDRGYCVRSHGYIGFESSSGLGGRCVASAAFATDGQPSPE